MSLTICDRYGNYCVLSFLVSKNYIWRDREEASEPLGHERRLGYNAESKNKRCNCTYSDEATRKGKASLRASTTAAKVNTEREEAANVRVEFPLRMQLPSSTDSIGDSL